MPRPRARSHSPGGSSYLVNVPTLNRLNSAPLQTGSIARRGATSFGVSRRGVGKRRRSSTLGSNRPRPYSAMQHFLRSLKKVGFSLFDHSCRRGHIGPSSLKQRLIVLSC
nr:MAG: replication polyprotein [Skomarfal virus 51]